MSGGWIKAWNYRHVSASILDQRGWGRGVDSQATEGSTGLAYTFGNSHVQWIPDPAGIPDEFWRSVGHSIAPAVANAVFRLTGERIRTLPML